ncbi:MAG TPA: hypothetical protein VH186_38115 [Chloroflexia bacterium]|nr:hypothetical protein [Chloroflexia bacterium]
MISRESMVDSRHGTFADKLQEASRQARIFNDYGEEIFVVGQWVPAGTYQLIDSTKIINLDKPGFLPPSFDGRRAEYLRVERPWIVMNN